MNKLENEKGKHRLIVLPIQPQPSNDFNGIGLALHFLLGNTIAVNTYLKEFWFVLAIYCNDSRIRSSIL